MKAARALARTALWAVAGLAGGLLLALVAPLAVGGRPYTVLSGSMAPTIAAGDMIVAERIPAREVRIGDVVTFQDPERGNRPTTHRVGGIRREAGRLAFVTKGDANDSVERWRAAPAGELGRVVYKIPEIGHVTALAGTRTGFILLVAVPLLLVAINELLRIWRPRRVPEGDGARG